MGKDFESFNSQVQREIVNVLYAKAFIDESRYRELTGGKISPPEGKYLEINRLKAMAIQAIDEDVFEATTEFMAMPNLIEVLYQTKFGHAEEQIVSMVRINFQGAISAVSLLEMGGEDFVKHKNTSLVLVDHFQGFVGQTGPRQEAMQKCVDCLRAAFVVAEAEEEMSAEDALKTIKQRERGGRS